MNSSPFIHSGSATAYTLPTDAPEGDGTCSWDSITLIVVKLGCGDLEGIGYTYSHKAAAPVARDLIDRAVGGANPFETNAVFAQMRL